MTPSSDDFRRGPLGLILCGGGSLGAWQAAALKELERAGLKFDAVLGFSAGSLNGAAYSLGVVDHAIEGWQQCDKLLRLSPRLSPPHIYSGDPVWERIHYAHDDERAKEQIRCRLVVPSTRWQRDRRIHAEFHPGGGKWDGPLAKHLMASCAIPMVFPPVTLTHDGEEHVLLDGGVPTRGSGFSFRPIGPVRDLVVLEMVRADEVGLSHWNPLRRFDQAGRDTCRRQMDEGVADWLAAHPDSRVYRLHPSRPLWPMLNFSAQLAAEALAIGAADGKAFLENPSGFLAGVPDLSRSPLGRCG